MICFYRWIRLLFRAGNQQNQFFHVHSYRLSFLFVKGREGSFWVGRKWDRSICRVIISKPSPRMHANLRSTVLVGWLAWLASVVENEMDDNMHSLACPFGCLCFMVFLSVDGDWNRRAWLCACCFVLCFVDAREWIMTWAWQPRCFLSTFMLLVLQWLFHLCFPIQNSVLCVSWLQSRLSHARQIDCFYHVHVEAPIRHLFIITNSRLQDVRYKIRSARRKMQELGANKHFSKNYCSYIYHAVVCRLNPRRK